MVTCRSRPRMLLDMKSQPGAAPTLRGRGGSWDAGAGKSWAVLAPNLPRGRNHSETEASSSVQPAIKNLWVEITRLVNREERRMTYRSSLTLMKCTLSFICGCEQTTTDDMIDSVVRNHRHVHIVFFEYILIATFQYNWLPLSANVFYLKHLKILFTGRPHGQVVKFTRSASGPRVSLVWILGADMVPLIKPCWGGVPHATTGRTHS